MIKFPNNFIFFFTDVTFPKTTRNRRKKKSFTNTKGVRYEEQSIHRVLKERKNLEVNKI
jgi:hypothetical protein